MKVKVKAHTRNGKRVAAHTREIGVFHMGGFDKNGNATHSRKTLPEKQSPGKRRMKRKKGFTHPFNQASMRTPIHTVSKNEGNRSKKSAPKHKR